MQEMLSENDVVRGALEVLQNYIDESPAIEFKNDTIIVPSMAKEYFSGLFDTVASIIVSESMEGKWERVDKLRQAYERAAFEFKQSTDLDDIELPKDIKLFFDEPKQALSQNIRYLIFDYLKGCLSYVEFIQRAFRVIDDLTFDFWHSGYEYWVYIALLNAFSPRQVSVVELDGVNKPLALRTRIFKPDKNNNLAGKRLPDAVVTTKYQKHYAIKLESSFDIGQSEGLYPASYDNISSCDRVTGRKRNCLLVYEINSLEAIPLSIDYSSESARRPSFSIEVAREDDLDNSFFMQDLDRRAAVLKSEIGHFTVVPTVASSRQKGAKGALSKTILENTRIMNTDFNITELHASVSSFAPYYGAQGRYSPKQFEPALGFF